MKGLLKAKSATSQLVTLLAVTAVSFFVLGSIGSLIVAMINHTDIDAINKMAQAATITPDMVPLIRGLQVVQFISLFMVPCVICSYLFSEKPGQYLGLKRPHSIAYIFVGILSMVVVYEFTVWIGIMNKEIRFPDSMQNWINEKEADAEKSVRAMLADRSISTLIINLIVIAGFAAIGEELLFRGMLQRIFIRMFRSPWAGIIVAAFLFSAMHMQFNGFLPRFALGILLGAVYWYSGSLWTAIITHFFYDAVLIILVHLYPSMLESENVVKISELAMVGIASLVLTIVLLRWMILRSKTRYEEVYAEELNAKDHPFEFEKKLR